MPRLCDTHRAASARGLTTLQKGAVYSRPHGANLTRRLALLGFSAAALATRTAAAAVINVSPSSGSTAYTLIEGAKPGDEVVLAPGTYPFRVYLQQQAPSSSPIFIHSQDPSHPAVVDLSSAAAGLVDNAPGSYTAGDKARGCWQLSGATNIHIDGIVFQNCHAADHDSAGIRYYNGTTGFLLTNAVFRSNDNGLTGGTIGSDGMTQSQATVEWSEFDANGNLAASSSSPTHNIYIYGGDFTLAILVPARSHPGTEPALQGHHVDHRVQLAQPREELHRRSDDQRRLRQQPRRVAVAVDDVPGQRDLRGQHAGEHEPDPGALQRRGVGLPGELSHHRAVQHARRRGRACRVRAPVERRRDAR